MTTEYTWTINQMERLTVDGYVTNAHYTVTAKDGVNSTFCYGTVGFVDRPETMIPYDELTKEIVIGWVQSNLGENGVRAIEDNLNAQIEAQVNPPIRPEILPIPWA